MHQATNSQATNVPYCTSMINVYQRPMLVVDALPKARLTRIQRVLMRANVQRYKGYAVEAHRPRSNKESLRRLSADAP